MYSAPKRAASMRSTGGATIASDGPTTISPGATVGGLRPRGRRRAGPRSTVMTCPATARKSHHALREFAPKAFVVACVCVPVVGCAEKSDSQQATDAVKAKIAERGNPSQISCRRSRVPGQVSDPSYWACSATLQQARTRFATCVSWDDPKRPVVDCRFSRRPPTKHHENLVF